MSLSTWAKFVTQIFRVSPFFSPTTSTRLEKPTCVNTVWSVDILHMLRAVPIPADFTFHSQLFSQLDMWRSIHGLVRVLLRIVWLAERLHCFFTGVTRSTSYCACTALWHTHAWTQQLQIESYSSSKRSSKYVATIRIGFASIIVLQADLPNIGLENPHEKWVVSLYSCIVPKDNSL